MRRVKMINLKVFSKGALVPYFTISLQITGVSPESYIRNV